MSLMRTAFWLGLLIMVLPIDQDPADKANTPEVSAWQAIGAAQTVLLATLPRLDAALPATA